MKRVLILLSTFNGSNYLHEQLDSLFAQENVKIHVLVRDDGSTDNTLSILKEYHEKFGHMTILAQSNIGCVRSFYTLMDIAVTQMPIFDYYAFCDQDDVWLPEKLSKATNQLDKSSTVNKLYFCSASYVDKDLKYLKKSKPLYIFNYKTCVFRNPVLGCTMVFDYEFLKIMNIDFYNRIRINGIIPLHDRWAYLCANYLGTHIINDPEAYINYRQHGSNVTTANKNILKRYVDAIKGVCKFKNKNLVFNKIFLHTYKNEIAISEKKEFLTTLCSYNHNIKQTLYFLRIQKWEGESNLDKFLWRILVVFRLF